jgi:hypothetical protein
MDNTRNFESQPTKTFKKCQSIPGEKTNSVKIDGFRNRKGTSSSVDHRDEGITHPRNTGGDSKDYDIPRPTDSFCAKNDPNPEEFPVQMMNSGHIIIDPTLTSIPVAMPLAMNPALRGYPVLMPSPFYCAPHPSYDPAYPQGIPHMIISGDSPQSGMIESLKYSQSLPAQLPLAHPQYQLNFTHPFMPMNYYPKLQVQIICQ